MLSAHMTGRSCAFVVRRNYMSPGEIDRSVGKNSAFTSTGQPYALRPGRPRSSASTPHPAGRLPVSLCPVSRVQNQRAGYPNQA
jgi:hypothetical protein